MKYSGNNSVSFYEWSLDCLLSKRIPIISQDTITGSGFVVWISCHSNAFCMYFTLPDLAVNMHLKGSRQTEGHSVPARGKHHVSTSGLLPALYHLWTVSLLAGSHHQTRRCHRLCNRGPHHERGCCWPQWYCHHACLSAYQWHYAHICLSGCLSGCFDWLSVCIWNSICDISASTCWYICLCLSLPANMPASICLYLSLSIDLSLSVSICLYMSLSVYRSLSASSS